MSARDHKVETVKLDNGAEGLLIHIPGASVMGLLFNFRAGYYLMSDEKWETPHIMEHMAFGANSQFDKARNFQAEYGKNGAYSNASTDDYHVTYETECADFEWERILKLMLLSFSEPIFLEDEFTAEYNNVYDELISRSNNRGTELSIEISKQLGLRSQQYADRVKLMSNVTVDDVKNHHAATHTTSNMRFVIAGNITPSRAKKIHSLLASMNLSHGSGRIELPTEIPKKNMKPVIIQKPDVPNVYFEAVSYIGGKFNDKQWTASGLITNILTGTLYSKILGEARERGLVYGMGSNFLYTKTDVGWWMSGQAQAVNLPELARISCREIIKLKQGDVDQSDIEGAKQFMLGSFQRSAQTVFGVARGYAGRYFFEGVVEDYYGVPKRIGLISKNDIVSVARETFGPAEWGVGLLGSCDTALGKEIQSLLEPIWQNKQT